MSINIKTKSIIFVTLALVIIIASALRFYKLGDIPASLSWDEAAVGYNAYTIVHWGKDEWGNDFPLFFKSFEDDKHPVHIYLSAIPIAVLGLNEFSTRFASALFGVLNVLLIFLIGRIIFKSNLLGLISALFLTVSPYAFQFSRYAQEANFALFFFMLGWLLFHLGVNKYRRLMALSVLSFGLSLMSYHSSLVVVPPIILLLIISNLRKLWRAKKSLLPALGVFILLVLIYWRNPALIGFARIQQTSISPDKIHETPLYIKTHNELWGRLEVTWNQYLLHFSSRYLFETGDKNARHSTQYMGEFYRADELLLPLGLLVILFFGLTRIKSAAPYLILLVWAALAPLPSSAVAEAPHAARALFMMGSFHLISGFGLYGLTKLLKFKVYKMAVIIGCLIIIGLQFKDYLNFYYQEYPKKFAIEWQYGMKQIVEFVSYHNGYTNVYMTDARSQPYIFFLYYLGIPLPDFLNSEKYNTTDSRSYNLISSFDKYHFGGWDPIESQPLPGFLYIVTPSQYRGLRFRDQLNVKKIVYYPDMSTAFYLVSIY